MPDFLPRRDADLVQWMQTFAAGVAADYASLGITLEQSEHLTALYESFHAAYRRKIDPNTGGRTATLAKDEHRDRLKRFARKCAVVARAQPGIRPEQLTVLGIRPAKLTKTRVGKPPTAPTLTLLRTREGGITLQLLDDAAGQSRGMPRHYPQASLSAFVGDCPPADPQRWMFLGTTSTARRRVLLPANVARATPPGATVWLSARWISRSGKMSPMSTPISTHACQFFAAPPQTLSTAA